MTRAKEDATLIIILDEHEVIAPTKSVMSKVHTQNPYEYELLDNSYTEVNAVGRQAIYD